MNTTSMTTTPVHESIFIAWRIDLHVWRTHCFSSQGCVIFIVFILYIFLFFHRSPQFAVVHDEMYGMERGPRGVMYGQAKYLTSLTSPEKMIDGQSSFMTFTLH